MSRRDIGLVALLEALYRVEQTRDAWLDQVLEAAHSAIQPSAGVGGVLYDLQSSTADRAEDLRGYRIALQWLEVGRKQHADPAFAALHKLAYGSLLCESTAQLAALDLGEVTQRMQS